MRELTSFCSEFVLLSLCTWVWSIPGRAPWGQGLLSSPWSCWHAAGVWSPHPQDARQPPEHRSPPASSVRHDHHHRAVHRVCDDGDVWGPVRDGRRRLPAHHHTGNTRPHPSEALTPTPAQQQT